MNRALELHRSKLAAVVASRESVILKLRPAHVLESNGLCGVDQGRAVAQDIDVTFGGARLVRRQGPLPDAIGEAALLLADKAQPHPLRLPLLFKGVIELRLRTAGGGEVLLVAGWAESTLVGSASPVGEV